MPLAVGGVQARVTCTTPAVADRAAGAPSGTDAAKTVPVSWVRLGLDKPERVAVKHGGGPAVYLGAGRTGCQPNSGLYHSRFVPPSRPQAVMVRPWKEAADDVLTSKYSPEAGKLVGATGSDGYSATVSAPVPWASTVVPASVATALCEGVSEDAVAQLLDPAGGAGGKGPVGAGGAGTVTVCCT